MAKPLEGAVPKSYRGAVSFILPVSQLTENIVYQTHITRFSAVLMAEIQIAQGKITLRFTWRRGSTDILNAEDLINPKPL
jgi:hypothetical protein